MTNILLRHSDPADATNEHTGNSDAIDRFLADTEQRRPVVLSTVQSAAEAEADAEARMAAKLHAFEQQFSSNSKPKAN